MSEIFIVNLMQFF